MIRGLTQDVELSSSGGDTRNPRAGQVRVPPVSVSVIGVISAGNLAVHRDEVKQALKRGLEQRPDAVWVCLEPKSDHLTHDVMLSLDIEPVVLPLNAAWQSKTDEHGYDFRRVWRDLEMLSLCDELIVFHKASGNSPWRDRAASGLYTRKLFVVDLGKEKPKAKKAA